MWFKPSAILTVAVAATVSASPAELSDTVCVGITCAIAAATAQDVAVTRHVYNTNPASMQDFLAFTISSFGVNGRLSDADEAETVQKGRGERIVDIAASSYMKLSPSATVWGDARFSTGQRRHIEWNNAADYDLVAPYVTGDSVGGNLSTRQYSFMGGYAGSSRGWGWGAEAAYTATIDYRDRDPRDKIIVSDLRIKAGGTRSIGKSYTIGVAGRLRIYNQESDVEFYNPNNDIHLYPLTGLGNFYPRFSSISGMNTSYKGIGAGGSLQLLPASRRGAIVNADFRYISMRQILRDFNNLELTRGDTYTLYATAGWLGKAGAVSYGVMADLGLSRRLGYENVFGSSVGNNYLTIGTRRNYLHDRLTGRLTVPLTVSFREAMTLDINPGATFVYDKESYRKPRRELSAQAITPALDLRFRKRFGRRWMLTVACGANHRFASEEVRNLKGLDLSSSLGKSVVANFDMLTADRTCVHALAGADIAIGSKMALGLSASYLHTAYRKYGVAQRAEVNINLKF